MRSRRTILLLLLVGAIFLLWRRFGEAGGDSGPDVGQPVTLDHVGVAVRELDSAERLYSTGLGFTVAHRSRLSNGLEVFSVWFADSTHLEILSPYDAALAPDVESFLAGHEGGMFFAMKATSAEVVADTLRKWGVEAEGPRGLSARIEGVDEESSEMFRLLSLAKGTLPGDPLVIVEYDREALERMNQRRPDLNPMRSTNHANGAMGIAAVWVAVRDLEAATDAFGSVGLGPDTLLAFPRLGAEGQVVFSDRGHILLLSPSEGSGGPVSDFLRARGDGVMGVTLWVRDLARARNAVGRVTRRPPNVGTNVYGSSVAVGPELTGGIWIELAQPGA